MLLISEGRLGSTRGPTNLTFLFLQPKMKYRTSAVTFLLSSFIWIFFLHVFSSSFQGWMYTLTYMWRWVSCTGFKRRSIRACLLYGLWCVLKRNKREFYSLDYFSELHRIRYWMYIKNWTQTPQPVVQLFVIVWKDSGGTRWRSWLRNCATSQKVAGSIFSLT
jgi:hypothetical protein